MVEIYHGQSAGFRLRFFYEDHSQNPPRAAFLSTEVARGKETPEIVVGLGERGELDEKRAARAVAKGVRFLRGLNATKMVVELDALIGALGVSCVRAAVLAALLALFQPENHRAQSDPVDFHLYLDGAFDRIDGAAEEIEEARILADAVCFARDLVNAPANLLDPAAMARRMEEKLHLPGMTTEILDEKQTAELGMEAFLTVGRSAAHPPRLIVLRYAGDPESGDTTALVGKGVTCDTGGYCIKEAKSMGGIRGDMAGAAAVFGAVWALARRGVKVNVTAVIPAAENRIAPDSFIPGDVIGSMSGRTIEIGNTDAEGRLILADAVTYAVRREKAARIVDIATLTGAVAGMFGSTTAGLMADGESFYEQFQKAAARSGEQFWRLPIYPEYEAMIEGDAADVRNMSTDGCGTITAGLFIRKFTEGLPWIHLDIAGTAWTDPPRWEFHSKGATGFGVTTLYDLCKILSGHDGGEAKK